MKLLTSIIPIALVPVLIRPTHAQVAVFDAPAAQQRAIHHFEDTLLTREMILNQERQFDLLGQQLEEMKTLTRVTGDPAKVNVLAGVDAILPSTSGANSTAGGGGVTVNISGNATFNYDGGGMFSAVGGSYRMFTGRDVERNEQNYRSFAAVDGTAANYDAAHEAAMARLTSLRQGMGQTLQQLQAGTDDATVQKLHGVLIVQAAELQAAAHEVTFAAQKAELQDIANRNDELRQAQARREEQVSEIEDAFTSWAQTLRSAPTRSRLDLNRR